MDVSSHSDEREATLARPQDLLRRGSPEDVYHAISAADPLGMRERCVVRMRRRAVLVDDERLFERALLRAAFAARTWDDSETLVAWLDERADEAIDDLLWQDEEGLRAGAESLEGWDERYTFLVYMLGIEPRLARRAAVAFNGLDQRIRSAFFTLLIEEKSVDECVALGYGPKEQLLIDVRGAFATLFGVEDSGRRRRR